MWYSGNDVNFPTFYNVPNKFHRTKYRNIIMKCSLTNIGFTI